MLYETVSDDPIGTQRKIIPRSIVLMEDYLGESTWKNFEVYYGRM